MIVFLMTEEYQKSKNDVCANGGQGMIAFVQAQCGSIGTLESWCFTIEVYRPEFIKEKMNKISAASRYGDNHLGFTAVCLVKREKIEEARIDTNCWNRMIDPPMYCTPLEYPADRKIDHTCQYDPYGGKLYGIVVQSMNAKYDKGRDNDACPAKKNTNWSSMIVIDVWSDTTEDTRNGYDGGAEQGSEI